MPRNHIFVRRVRPEDADTFVKWSAETPQNLWDPDALKYPSSFAVCAFDQNGPLVYAPTQTPFMMESLAIRPGANPIQVAHALEEITEFLVSLADIRGVGEIYFLCKDEATIEFAKRHCFKELPYRVFRVKLLDLEKQEQPDENKD